MVLSLKGRRYRFLGRYNHEKLAQTESFAFFTSLLWSKEGGPEQWTPPLGHPRTRIVHRDTSCPHGTNPLQLDYEI